MRNGDSESLRIAVCDDTPDDRAALERVLAEYLAAHGRNDSVTSFADARTLLAANAVEPFDLLVLDVVLSGTTGIELAELLRTAGSTAPVVFASTSAEYAAASYGVGVSYLLKPYTDAQFGVAFDRALAASAQRHDETVVFKCADGTRRVAAKDIRRAETRGHYQDVSVTTGETFSVRMSHAEFFDCVKTLAPFVEAGLSSVLNLSHVRKVADGRAFFDDGVDIVIPRRLYAAVHDAFFRHFCG